jgi:hypothetical protein
MSYKWVSRIASLLRDAVEWTHRYTDRAEGTYMATIPEIEARIHALWAKGDARTRDESVELGRLLTALETDMPPGDF